MAEVRQAIRTWAKHVDRAIDARPAADVKSLSMTLSIPKWTTLSRP
jgi:hypothetical protein